MDRITTEVNRLCSEDAQFNAARDRYESCAELVDQAEAQLKLCKQLLQNESDLIDRIRNDVERELRDDKDFMTPRHDGGKDGQ